MKLAKLAVDRGDIVTIKGERYVCLERGMFTEIQSRKLEPGEIPPEQYESRPRSCIVTFMCFLLWLWIIL